MSNRPLRKRTDFIVWHCSASGPNTDIGVKEIDAMHRKNGWSGIGYHYVIRRNGTVELGENASNVGAHVQGFNSVSLGVCLVGGVDTKGKADNNFTDAQWAAARALYHELTNKYPGAKHCGHRDLSPDKNGDGVIKSDEWLKQCPCFSVADWECAGLQPIKGVGNKLPVSVPKKAS